MAGEPKRRACIFCGSAENKMSKEHVWARWMRHYVDGDEKTSIGHSRTHATREGEIRHHDDWRDIPFNWQVAGPCKPCNEGWMEGLENAAKPFLTPMLENRPVQLDPVAQDAVATWATLKVLMAHRARPKGTHRIVPEARYSEFYRRPAALPGAQVWMGRYNGAGSWPTSLRYRELFVIADGMPDPPTPNAYLFAFHVGYAAFAYWGHEVEYLAVESLGDLSRFLTPIWPAWGTAAWPPTGLLGADGLDAVLAGFPLT